MCKKTSELRLTPWSRFVPEKLQFLEQSRSFAHIIEPRWGAKGFVCGPEGARYADNRMLIKLRKCHLFLPSPILVCPCHGP
jgi:hypothetical protein